MMNNKKVVVSIFFLIFCMGLGRLVWLRRNVHKGLTIGVLQIASHPALDQAREGFVSWVGAHAQRPISFIFQNAEGSMANLQMMAQCLHNRPDINAFFTIGTAASQAMAHHEKQRPIIITAVTDPWAAGLVHPGTNVCGTFEKVDIEQEIGLMQRLFPTIKKVALLFAPGELNAEVMSKKLRKILLHKGFQVFDVGISSENDVQAAMLLACRKADVVLTPTDNTVALAMPLLARIARQNKKPLMASDPLLAVHGPLIAFGFDYRAGGRQSAQIALLVLEQGKKPSELSISAPEQNSIVVNKKTAQELEIPIPDWLQNIAHIISA